jgi:hypothetical protein
MEAPAAKARRKIENLCTNCFWKNKNTAPENDKRLMKPVDRSIERKVGILKFQRGRIC